MTRYINHLTLTTGHCRRSPRSEVTDETLALMRPWLSAAIATTEPISLPVDELSHFSAVAIHEVGLVVTLYGPIGPHIPGKPHKGDKAPIVTFGVAERSRESAVLFAKLEKHFGRCAVSRPEVPWCAVALHDNLAAFTEALDWIGDFERCVAWAWITHQIRRPADNSGS